MQILQRQLAVTSWHFKAAFLSCLCSLVTLMGMADWRFQSANWSQTSTETACVGVPQAIMVSGIIS